MRWTFEDISDAVATLKFNESFRDRLLDILGTGVYLNVDKSTKDGRIEEEIEVILKHMWPLVGSYKVTTVE